MAPAPYKAAPISFLVWLAFAPQAGQAMEQAILLETPSGPLPGAPVIRPPLPREVLRGPSGPPQWEVVEEDSPSRWAKSSEPSPKAGVIREQPSLNWELVRPVQPPVADRPDQPESEQRQIAAGPTWEPILPGEEISTADVAREIEAQESARKEASAKVDLEQSDTTFSGFQNLYRIQRWYPSTSTIVPMDIGPSGIVAGIGFSGSDCRTNSDICIREYTLSDNSINNRTEVVRESFLEIGISSHSEDALISQTSVSGASSSKRLLLDRRQTGYTVGSNLDINPAPKLSAGAGGALLLNSKESINLNSKKSINRLNSAEMPRSGFSMVSSPTPPPGEPVPESTRQTRPFSDLHSTLRIVNNTSRPSVGEIHAQIQNSKRSECDETPCIPARFKTERIRRSERSELSPVGAVVIAEADKLNLIAERPSRNLNNLATISAVRNVGLIATARIGRLTRSSVNVNNRPSQQAVCPTCDFRNPSTQSPIFYLPMISIRF